ncbi:uncharacterized protein HMPREF1541_07406 [Cyphellophora europaea CBS 101466]|uniref:BSD domain-containing protein n=1 Tax=Cyphellophora europaea (strain CBS 101466) TaxID=1220924 RepID=W2RPZ7_CYPE1|nr:uncharacterized protein HMPREF1541_07406 [Cyphellophora europaea CBS 101466]ETN37783.1 hypothetical protein HMPREF1541_07406 [Cyphellophora europaea CBS 101466]
MALSRANTLYKTLKQNGVLALPKDGKSITWSPDQPSGAPPSLTIAIQDVSNLQKTPETAKKAMLKIFAKGSADANAIDHTFTFTSAEARTEIEAITERIRKLIDDYKKEQLAAANSSGGQSAAMTIANAISGGRGVGQLWEDDDKLKTDVKLQQTLMQEDPQLQRTFMEALSVKPDSITNLQFTQQFWASRVHLLRAYALAQQQNRGRSNVFSDIGAIGSGKTVSITSEQIHIIFEQYPLVRRVYDELVPKYYNEAGFWKRFFQSQLYLTLRGMKTDDRINRKDEHIDSEQYLNAPELTGLRPTGVELHIPKFIDLEGNEENHSQRQGNKPDVENNQANLEKAPVIRKLNALSEKLMAVVRQSEADASAPIGPMEAEYEQLRLRDLEGDPEQHRIVLNIRDQRRFFSDNQATEGDVNPFRTVDPAKAINSVLKDLTNAFPQPGVGSIPIPEFEDIDMEDDEAPKASGAMHAHNHIISLIESHRSLTTAVPEHSTLPAAIYERLTLTHATSIEFLRQFWSAFLSGDSSRANEITALVDSLIRATERINAIAEDAQARRSAQIKHFEDEAKQKARLTGSRPQKVNYEKLQGGGDVVRDLMQPILASLSKAEQAYRKAYAEQSKEAAGDEGTPQPA